MATDITDYERERDAAWLRMDSAVKYGWPHLRECWSALCRICHYNASEVCQACGFELDWDSRDSTMRSTCESCGAVNEIEAEGGGESGCEFSWAAVRVVEP